MSDWALLGLLATGFYLYECCTWTPAAAFACYRRPFRRTWVASSGAELPGNESGGCALSDPLTSSGNIIHCSHWPIAVSPDGVCLDSADASHVWTFDSIQSISSQERTIRFNGEIAFRTASESLALELAGDLETLRQLPAGQRADAIRASLGQSFDPEALQTEWSRFLKSSRALTRIAVMPFAWLAVIAPVVVVLAGPLKSWPFLLAGLFLTGLAVSAEFVRVHRKELPRVSDRWLHAVSMTLFPIAAIRAADRISKERVAQFNPSAVVGVFCNEADGDPILRRFGFDLDRVVAGDAGTPVSICRESYRSQKRSAFGVLLKALQRDPFIAPKQVDEDVVAYCPRCHEQFQDGTDECSDCADVKLIRFDQATAVKSERTRKRKRA